MAADGPRGAASAAFDPDCRACARLAVFLDGVRARYPGYYCRPVPSFGDPAACFLIVGLAPGMHGANATGRPFTGDHAGVILYRTLYEFGYASAPVSAARDDGLVLRGCRITNAVRCLPPQNKPQPAEVRNCNAYLRAELAGLRRPAVILALGTVAHAAVLRALDAAVREFPFGHGRWHFPAAGLALVDSYHCSRYNIQTRRLTSAMFREIFGAIRVRLDESDGKPVR